MWDRTSREFFDPATVQVESYKLPPAFTFSSSELISLAGAPENSRILCEDVGGVLDLTVINETLFVNPFRLSLVETSRNERVAFAHFVDVRGRFQKKGIAARMLWSSARACSKFGIGTIRSFGLSTTGQSSDAGKDWSGAVAAVALGFDANLPDCVLHELPSSLRESRSIRELVRTPEGASWWKANPTALEVFFDTSQRSKSMQFLGTYIRNNKIRMFQ